MRVLILGGNDMLGHKLWQLCRDRCDTYVTVDDGIRYRQPSLFDADRTISVDVWRIGTVTQAINSIVPEVIVNCVGVAKQAEQAKNPIASITINALFPHRVAEVAAERGMRLIHVSTDCVFSGRKGQYREDDLPDADDLYGRSRLLGETREAPALTIRTSIIGRELQSKSGLVEWFLAHADGRVVGHRRAIFSGLTTIALARVIAGLLERREVTGLYHVSSEPIDKYHLLRQLNDAYHAGVVIDPADEPEIDRSLNSDRFRSAFGWNPPSWPEMIAEMAEDPTPYEQWR